jgi:hypothetical protein
VLWGRGQKKERWERSNLILSTYSFRCQSSTHLFEVLLMNSHLYQRDPDIVGRSCARSFTQFVSSSGAETAGCH